MKIPNNKHIFSKLLATLLILLLAVACNSSGSEPAMEEMDHDGAEMDHGDGDGEMDHDEIHAAGRIPNQDGAAIHITSPASGATFKTGDQILIEIEVENFTLGENANHWHVYVDGISFGMVMGKNTDQPISGIEPGEHEVAVYLSIQSHEEFEDGDMVMITVE